jgi:hypothetical protein
VHANKRDYVKEFLIPLHVNWLAIIFKIFGYRWKLGPNKSSQTLKVEYKKRSPSDDKKGREVYKNRGNHKITAK